MERKPLILEGKLSVSVPSVTSVFHCLHSVPAPLRGAAGAALRALGAGQREWKSLRFRTGFHLENQLMQRTGSLQLALKIAEKFALIEGADREFFQSKKTTM